MSAEPMPADVIDQVRKHRQWHAEFRALNDEYLPMKARHNELRSSEPYLLGGNNIQIWALSDPNSPIYKAIARLLDISESS